MKPAETLSLADLIGITVDHRRLHLTIMPTEKCNFRCTYCYEDFSVGRMKRPVIDALKRLIASRAGDLKQLSISWFGGEPLLQREIVEEVSGFAHGLCRETGCTFRGDVTTNAYLLGLDTAAGLVSCGVRHFQVSLDGDRDTHGLTRRLANGGNSFDVIWGNLLAIRGSSLDLRVRLRVHYTGASEAGLADFGRTLAEVFGGDERFDLFVRPISRLGGENDAAIAPVSLEANRKVVERVRGAVEGSGLSPTTWDLGEGAPLCYAAAPNHFLVRADGRIGKCTVALRQDVNSVGELRPDGTLALDQDKLRKWSRGLASGDRGELTCPMRGIA
jgi:uncharacterized protein